MTLEFDQPSGDPSPLRDDRWIQDRHKGRFIVFALGGIETRNSSAKPKATARSAVIFLRIFLDTEVVIPASFQ